MGLAHRAQPMGNHHDRPSLGNRRHIPLNHRFGLIVQRAGRLVENQNAGVRDQGPRDGNPLALPARQGTAVLTNHRVVAVRQFQDKLMGTGQLRRLNHLFHRQAGIGQRDIAPH